jgi:hypothetical protein
VVVVVLCFVIESAILYCTTDGSYSSLVIISFRVCLRILRLSEFNVVSCCNTLSILSSPALLTVTLVLPVALLVNDRDDNSSTGC